jgi:hypothetical protein
VVDEAVDHMAVLAAGMRPTAAQRYQRRRAEKAVEPIIPGSGFAGEVRQQFPGADVVDILERVSREIGYPNTIRVDNGPEFSARSSIDGPSSPASRSTSAGPANRPTTPLSKP